MIVRRAAGVFHARKSPGKNGAPLHPWRHKTEAVQRMGNPVATIGHIHRGRGTVGDSGKALAQSVIKPTYKLRRGKGRRRQHQTVGVQAGTVGAIHRPAGRVRLRRLQTDARDRTALTQRSEAEAFGQRGNEALHPGLQGDEQTPARPARALGRLRIAAGRSPERVNHAPLLTLHMQKTRHGRGQAELVGVRGIDTANEGLGNTFERFPPEPSAHKRAQAFVALFPGSGQYQIERHTQLARPGKNTRTQQGTKLSGSQ